MKLFNSHGVLVQSSKGDYYDWTDKCIVHLAAQICDGVEIPSKGFICSIKQLKNSMAPNKQTGLHALAQEAAAKVVFDDVLLWQLTIEQKSCKGLIFMSQGQPVLFTNIRMNFKAGTNLVEMINYMGQYKWTSIPKWGEEELDLIDSILSLGRGHLLVKAEAAEPKTATAPSKPKFTAAPLPPAPTFTEFAQYPDAYQFDVDPGYVIPLKGDKLSGSKVSKTFDANGDTNREGKPVMAYVQTGVGVSKTVYAIVQK